jgi:hypothetical protein
MARSDSAQVEQSDFRFEGFRSPRYTQVPDEAFDVVMAEVTPAEFKVMMYIIRRTFGFHKSADAISLRQIVSGLRTRDGRALDHGTGLSKAGAVKAIQGLVAKGVLLTERRCRGGHQFDATVYRLRMADETSTPPVNSVDRTVVIESPVPVYSPDSPYLPGAQPPVQPVDSQLRVFDSESETQQHTNTPEVVAESSEPHEPANHTPLNDHAADLIEELSSLGVAATPARNLLTTHGERKVSEVIEWVRLRKTEGWRPRTSFAAWVTAALRDGYDLAPLNRGEPPPPALLDPQANVDRGRHLPPGVTQEEADLWLAVLGRLRAAGEWTPILSACFLRRESAASFQVLVPRREFLVAVEDREEVLREALAAETGAQVGLGLSVLDRRQEGVRDLIAADS